MSWFFISSLLFSAIPQDSVQPFYYDGTGFEVITDAPWVIGIDDTINFLFYTQDNYMKLHAIALYNLTDRQHHYYWGWLRCWGIERNGERNAKNQNH